MEELAEELDADTERLLDRWDGRPDYVIEDIFRVRDLVTKEVTDLQLTPYQRQFTHAFFFGDESEIAVLKGRRTGYSFITCACILVKAMMLPHSFHAITGPSKSQAKDRIDDIYDLIDWARVDIATPTDNRDELTIWNDSTVMAFSGNPDTSRGADSADTLFIDEQAFLEDQQETLRAFGPFVALGDTTTVKISTPRTSNDEFMKTVGRGAPAGANGIISIEQPAFKKPDDINPEVSLFEQNVEPVMPYLDLEKVERDRARDPRGFEQEYLCKTVEDSYRFFTAKGIDRAVTRGGVESYVWHPATHARHKDGVMVMGVDIGIDRDDTAIAVFEHLGDKRLLRFHTALDRGDLRALDLPHESVDNPEAVADYVYGVAENMGVERVFLDKTGPGKGFQKEIEKRLGRRAVGFNFTDKDEVQRMMGDFNYALHNDLITLYPDDDLTEQLKAIVKEQTHETTKPRFSGKDHAPNGKDDLAMAAVLGAFPPNFQADRATTPTQRDQAYSEEYDYGDHEDDEEDDRWRGLVHSHGSAEDTRSGGSVVYGGSSGNRTKRRYQGRHER